MGFFDSVGGSISNLFGDGVGELFNPFSAGNFGMLSSSIDPAGAITDPLEAQQQSDIAARAYQLITSGMDQANAIQLAMLEQSIALSAPWRKAGKKGLKYLRRFGKRGAKYGLQALDQLAGEALAGPGLSQGEQFRLGEAEKSINRYLASRGLYKSGRPATEALTQAAGRITSESEGRRLAQLQGLLGFGSGAGQTLAGLGGQLTGAAMGLPVQTGGGIAQTYGSGYSTLAQLPYIQQSINRSGNMLPQMIGAIGSIWGGG
jgi:hypothetical protein